jgi:molecular chaperone GrpE
VSDVEIKTEGDAEGTEGAEGAEEATASETEASAQPSELEQLAAERDKLKDQLLRTAADFDNFRKRTKKDLEQAERRGREEVLREVLPVIDNLERAVAAAAGASDVEAVRDGVQMVLKLFEDTASRIGLERVESVGQRFDPNVHDAFQQQETDEHPPGTIVAEYQPGYKLGDRLLRPAMVVVASKPKPREPEGGSEAS